VEQGVADLKADNEAQLLDSLREINSSVTIFQRAGYDLSGVDMELSPVQRLIVHLNRVQDVSASEIGRLASANQHRKLTHALLKALVQAEGMADQVDLENLVYHKLIVNVGPIPAVRLCWKPEDEPFAAPQPVVATAKLPTTTSASVGSTGPSSFATYGKGSFFEQRAGSGDQSQPETSAGTATEAHAAAGGSTQPSAREESAVSGQHVPSRTHATARSGKAWGKESLDRFKQMPTGSKYRR
jgi:hypothetical protein